MLQKLITVPALGAVLLASTAVLFVQKADLGLAPASPSGVSNLPQKISDVSMDPSSNELFERNRANTQPQKLASAADTKVEINKVQVASQTVYKPQPQVALAEVENLIRKYAAEYRANPEVMVIIARCESGFRADAISPSGAYKGMYQFVTSTWQSNRRAMGLDDNPALMFDAEEAIKTAAFKMGRDGYGAWPVCSQKAFASLALN